MDKERAQKEIERIFEQCSGFELAFEDWTGTGEDDLCVTINHQQGDYVTHLYLTGEDGDVFLYVGEDVIDVLTEANVWRVLAYDAMHSAEVLADEIERLEAELKQARADERERCAKVCEMHAAGWRGPVVFNGARADEARLCADDIRASNG
ncbi:MAG: hypothetical protein EHM35_00405 [Planctomycetaceae bacterium]|nr:MAG: hypothetical protein EHM35_00405 [Planctomycetaceae bacterium]